MAKQPAPKKTKAKSTAPKAAPAKKAAAKPAAQVGSTALTRHEETMSIRKIKNGYVVRRSWTEGTGMKAKYQEEEVFTAKRPVIEV